MENPQKQADELVNSVYDAINRLNITNLEKQLEGVNRQTNDSDLWQDNGRAQNLMKLQSDLELRITTWRNIEKSTIETRDLLKLGDDSLTADLQKQLLINQKQFDSLKKELLFGDKFDNYAVIMSIYAGAGGTDAQDWAQMLLRMYVRWAEQNNFSCATIEQSFGDEAGIKSVTLELSGSFAFGKLKSENGVHRLVRLSPYNSDNLRQTSFAKVEIMPKIDKPDEVEIDDKDIKVDVFRSGGKGGQSVNTTDSAVRLTHTPTGIVVSIQNERSQLQNKETAMTLLRSKLTALQLEQHSESIAKLKGPNEQASWGNQIRSYVLHPYKQVKDLRTNFVTTEAESVLDGNLNEFITAYLELTIG